MTAFVAPVSMLAFAALWALIGYTDFARQRIQHRYLFWGLWVVAAGYLVMAAAAAAGPGWRELLHPHGFFRVAGTHVLLSGMAAVALWQFRIWPAGDAKLFLLLACLYPLTVTDGMSRYERLFFAALVNAFLPAGVYVFARACAYVVDTRVRHARAFFTGMGWRRELTFVGQQGSEAAASLRPWLQKAGKELAADPWSPVKLVMQWLLGSAVMAVLSYHLHDFFKSPLLLSVLCMAAFFAWSRLRALLSGPVGAVLGLSILSGLLFMDGTPDWKRLAGLFGNISVFGFFMFLGMNLAMRWFSVGGYLGFVFPFLISLVVWAARYLIDGFLSLLRRLAAALPSLTGLQPQGGGAAAPAPFQLPAEFAPYFETLTQMAGFGLFFGLSLVLVRKWDDEVRPSHTREALASYLILSPEIIDRLKADKKFYDKHFKTLYADGLTTEQAEALKRWCEKKGIAEVALTPTISFASWIFFGYFLCRLMDGKHILEVLLQ